MSGHERANHVEDEARLLEAREGHGLRRRVGIQPRALRSNSEESIINFAVYTVTARHLPDHLIASVVVAAHKSAAVD